MTEVDCEKLAAIEAAVKQLSPLIDLDGTRSIANKTLCTFCPFLCRAAWRPLRSSGRMDLLQVPTANMSRRYGKFPLEICFDDSRCTPGRRQASGSDEKYNAERT